MPMPLIRYRIGDLGMWEEGRCSCGRGLPRLRSVSGRVTDFLVGSDGRLVSGVFLATYVIGRRPSLGQVQIQQETAGQVLFRIRRGPNSAIPMTSIICNKRRAYTSARIRSSIGNM